MINRQPRAGYGYGIVRLTRELAEYIAPLAQIRLTDVQGYLHDQGVFEQLRQSLHLPDDWRVMAIYVEGYRLTWCVLLEAPEIPWPEEGELLPVLAPIYESLFDAESGTRTVRLDHVEVNNGPSYTLTTAWIKANAPMGVLDDGGIPIQQPGAQPGGNEITRVIAFEHAGEKVAVEVHICLTKEEIERVICPVVEQSITRQFRMTPQQRQFSMERGSLKDV